MNLLSPYVMSTSDILGNYDINNLLGLFPSIERQHFKLWLSGTNILSRVLNHAIFVATGFTVETLNSKMQRFVENRSLYEASKLLESQHTVIISGPPGVGKTTLAEMILLRYMAEGYEPLRISFDLKEGFDVLDSTQRQVFFFDDFLGQLRLTAAALGHTEARVETFIHIVKDSPRTRFVLTTREYILKQAQMLSETLDDERVRFSTYLLDIGAYTKLIKARILYNHVYFSNMPRQYKKMIVKDHFYKEIIDHPNYSPRIIEWISDWTHFVDVQVATYQDFIRATLQRPDRLWAHAFYRHLSSAGQELLIVLAFLPDNASLDNVGKAFQSFHKASAERHTQATTPFDFRDALKEVNESFIVFEAEQLKFVNPSVRDFLERVVNDNSVYLETLLSSAVFFRQVSFIWEFLKEARRDAWGHSQPARDGVPERLTSAIEGVADRPAYEVVKGLGWQGRREIDEPLWRRALVILELYTAFGRSAAPAALRRVLAKMASDEIDGTDEWRGRIRVLRALTVAERQFAERGKFIQCIKDCLLAALRDAPFRCIEWFYDFMKLGDEQERLLSPAEWKAMVGTLGDYLEDYAMDELSEMDRSEEVVDFEWMLEQLASKTGVDAKPLLYAARERIDELEREYDDEDERVDYRGRPAMVVDSRSEEREIEELFAGLA